MINSKTNWKNWGQSLKKRRFHSCKGETKLSMAWRQSLQIMLIGSTMSSLCWSKEPKTTLKKPKKKSWRKRMMTCYACLLRSNIFRRLLEFLISGEKLSRTMQCLVCSLLKKTHLSLNIWLGCRFRKKSSHSPRSLLRWNLKRMTSLL